MPTMKEMCEAIVEADILRLPGGIAPTAEQIWESSTTGELSHVFYWYEYAKEILEGRRKT